VSKYSVTVGCNVVDVVAELDAVAALGAVGVLCWLQDAIDSAASESATNGRIRRGDVSDMRLLPCEPDMFRAHRLRRSCVRKRRATI
jgi:hypothetical protein